MQTILLPTETKPTTLQLKVDNDSLGLTDEIETTIGTNFLMNVRCQRTSHSLCKESRCQTKNYTYKQKLHFKVTQKINTQTDFRKDW